MTNLLDRGWLIEMESFSVDMARECGRILRQYSQNFVDVQFKDRYQTDPVTEVDFRIQEYVRETIYKELPSHDILSEEDSASQIGTANLKDFVWCLDPLDGTANFIGGFGFYGVSIALLYRGCPVVGTIYIPEGLSGGGVYHARIGGGAFYEDDPIAVSGHKYPVPSGLIGLPANVDRIFDIKREGFHSLGETRVTGSMSCEMAMVAAGTFQYSLMWKPRIWDVAAGAILISEAGGGILEWKSGSWRSFSDFNTESVTVGTDSAITKEKLSSWVTPLLMGTPDLIEHISRRVRVKNTIWRAASEKIRQIFYRN